MKLRSPDNPPGKTTVEAAREDMELFVAAIRSDVMRVVESANLSEAERDEYFDALERATERVRADFERRFGAAKPTN